MDEEKRERRRDEKERKEKDKLTEKKCTGTQEHIKKEEAIDSKLGSVSRPRSSSFNGSFMFAGSSITYGRWIGGKDPEEVVCLGNEEVQRSEAEKTKPDQTLRHSLQSLTLFFFLHKSGNAHGGKGG